MTFTGTPALIVMCVVGALFLAAVIGWAWSLWQFSDSVIELWVRQERRRR